MKREALRVTSTIPVAPTTLYFAWIDSEHHSSMTGGAAKLEPVVGAKYSAVGGYVTGKLVILDLGRRIVMSWRTTDFPRDAADSRVEVHFETLGPSTRILILHTEIPEGQSEQYKTLWNDKYITPMRAYFSKFLPDPRNPPVRRPPPPPPEGGEDDEPEEKPKSKLAMMKAAKAAEAAARAASAARLPRPAPSSGPGVHKAETKPAKPSKAAPAKPSPASVPAVPAPKVAPKAAKPAPKAAPPAPKPAPKAKKPAPKKPAKPAPKAKKPAPKAKKPAKPAPKAKKKKKKKR